MSTAKKDPAPEVDPEFRAISSIETTLHRPDRDRWEPGSDEGGVRLYCAASPETHGDEARWALQLRTRVRTRRLPSKHFAIGTASMSRADLRWLRDLIDDALRRKP